MMRTLLYTTALIVGTGAMAHAQSTSNSTTQGTAQAVAIVQGGSSTGTSDGGTQHVYERLNNNVDAVAPTIYSNTPCGNSVSGGLALGGVGVSLGASSEMRSCVDRQWFVLTMSAYDHTHDFRFMQWAVGMACTDEKMAKVAPAGFCNQPVPVAAASPAPVVATAAPAAPAPHHVKPDYCGTASASELRSHPECAG
jgi:hypothetical protein